MEFNRIHGKIGRKNVKSTQILNKPPLSHIISLYILVSLTLGCTTVSPPIKYPEITETKLPPEAFIYGIKPIKASDEASCVPTSLEMVFKYYGKELIKEEISNWIQRAYGSSKEDLERFLLIHEFEVYTFYDWSSDKRKIKYFLSQGYPVLICGQLGRGWGSLHMTLVIGYDDNLEAPESKMNPQIVKGFFYVNEPALGVKATISYKNFKEFQKTDTDSLRNYCLVTYPKSYMKVRPAGGSKSGR